VVSALEGLIAASTFGSGGVTSCGLEVEIGRLARDLRTAIAATAWRIALAILDEPDRRDRGCERDPEPQQDARRVRTVFRIDERVTREHREITYRADRSGRDLSTGFGGAGRWRRRSRRRRRDGAAVTAVVAVASASTDALQRAREAEASASMTV